MTRVFVMDVELIRIEQWLIRKYYIEFKEILEKYRLKDGLIYILASLSGHLRFYNFKYYRLVTLLTT